MAVWGEQFKKGDQDKSTRCTFWISHFKQCPKCLKSEIEEERVPAGCRMNGDAYGTTVFTCKGCQWVTSFQWDDSSDCFYYETQHWDLPKDTK